MRILFVTSEVATLIKTGGLADVSAALPAALRKLKVDVRILLPGYSQVMDLLTGLEQVADLRRKLKGWPASKLLTGKMNNGVPVYVLDCPVMFQRGGSLYVDEYGVDWPDNAQRFALLSRVAALLGCARTPLQWKPDVVHGNDWQTGLTPVYLLQEKKSVPVVMTIHNLAYQGNFPSHLVPELGLSWDLFQPEGIEFYGHLSFLKAGLYFSQHLTTVSPTYASEIQTEAQGHGMQGLLSYRQQVLSGILNGIDTDEWNPAKDEYIASQYDAGHLLAKQQNKLELQNRLGLHVDKNIPLLGLVSRFAYQKGVDIVLRSAERIIGMPAQLVLMGTGDVDLQNEALALAHRHTGKVAAFVGFDEGLSHLIEAGADIFLMPSRYEPCGLNQMYSQRYGTPPLVHATGGLVDSVVDCNAETLASGKASGFVFDKLDKDTFVLAVKRAIEIYRDNDAWRSLQLSCMRKDLSWTPSARAYLEIYQKLIH